MTSEQIRDPLKDNLLTPANCALVIIDYQPTQVNSIRSMDRAELVDHVVRVAKTAVLYKLPIVLSTVNVKSGRNQPTIAALETVLPIARFEHPPSSREGTPRCGVRAGSARNKFDLGVIGHGLLSSRRQISRYAESVSFLAINTCENPSRSRPCRRSTDMAL